MSNHDTKYGVLFFDVPEVHQQGWLCMVGEDPVRVQGTHLVPDNYCVITNLDFTQMKQSGLAPHRFFNRDWFVRRMDPLIVEFALQKEDISVQVKFFSELFGHCMRWIDALLDIDAPHPFGMVATIRDAWGEDTQGQTPFQVLDAADNALHYYKKAEMSPGSMVEATSTLYLPRIYHAHAILSKMLPRPGVLWRRIHKSNYPKSEKLIPQWLAKHNPMLIQTIITNTHPIMHHLINPGGDLKKGNAPRLWHSSDELDMLSHFSEVQIVDAWECSSSYNLMDDIFGFLNDMTDEQQESAWVSPSYHMFLEGVWKAATVCKPLAGEDKFTTPHSAYIRSLDILGCLAMAYNLSDVNSKNVPWAAVSGFGSGGIRVAVPSDVLEKDSYLSDLSMRFDLYPPMPESLVFTDFSDDHIDTHDGIVRAMYLSKDRESMLEADNEALDLFS